MVWLSSAKFGTPGGSGRGNHARVARLESRLLLGDPGALQKILEQALVDRGGALQFAQGDRLGVVETGLAAHLLEVLFDRLLARHGELVLVVDVLVRRAISASMARRMSDNCARRLTTAG